MPFTPRTACTNHTIGTFSPSTHLVPPKTKLLRWFSLLLPRKEEETDDHNMDQIFGGLDHVIEDSASDQDSSKEEELRPSMRYIVWPVTSNEQQRAATSLATSQTDGSCRAAHATYSRASELRGVVCPGPQTTALAFCGCP